MTREIMNSKPFEYTSSNGTTFKSERCDLKCGVNVSFGFKISIEQKMADFAEFGAMHSILILNNLNGFAGYDAIQYIYENPDLLESE